MGELDQKRQEADKLRQEIRDLEERERIEKLWPEWRAREGTFWKFRNSYSCPQSDDEKWWIYRRISNVTKDGCMDLLDFQIDNDGRLDVRERKRTSWIFESWSGWNPATAEEWHEAARIAEAITAKLLFT